MVMMIFVMIIILVIPLLRRMMMMMKLIKFDDGCTCDQNADNDFGDYAADDYDDNTIAKYKRKINLRQFKQPCPSRIEMC